MIGDSPIDIEFAKNCGIDGAFAKWGFYKPEDLTAKASYYLSKPQELYKIDGIDEVVEIEVTSELDLHTFIPKDVGLLIRDYLYTANKKGFKTVRIIHGKGIGVQRRIVRDILKKSSLVENFYDAPPYIGGLGATIVELKG